jgi:hypothetical protein
MSNAPSRTVVTKVFFDEKIGIWSSPNMTTLYQPVPPFDMQIPSNSRYKDFRSPRWLSNTYPYLAFWPIYISFSGPIFSRLNLCEQSLRIVTLQANKYTLAPDIVTSWQRLEHALLGLSMFLIKRKFGNVAELGYLPLPHECGYTSVHAEPRYVKGCAYKTRDAFVTLSTICTFAIAANMINSDKYTPEPEWVTACRAEGVHAQWLTDLQASFVCNFAPGLRPGAFLHGYKSCWADAIPAFLGANVPLWISWGHSSQVPMDPKMNMFLPTPNEANAAKRVATSIPPPHQHMYESPEGHGGEQLSMHTDSVGAYSDFDMVPDPQPRSRQLKGETLREFREHMELERREFLDGQTVDRWEYVHQTELEAEKQAYDESILEPTIGSTMYVWVNFPGGNQLRKQVPREEWSVCWSRCPPSLKRYYFVIDEWDLEHDVTEGRMYSDPPASGFESSLVVNSDDDERIVDRQPEHADSVQQPDDAQLPTSIIRPQPLTSAPIGAEQSFAADIMNMYGASVLSNTVETPPLQNILRDRYGFLVLGVYEQHPRMRLHGKVSANTSRLGLKHHFPHDFQKAVLDLFNFVVYNGKFPIAFPPLWNLGPDLSHAIESHPKFVHVRVSDKLYLVGVTGTPLVAQWYLLAVPEACTVLQIFRENNDSLLGVIRSLLSRGMQFSTVKCLRSVPRETLKQRPSQGLGHRSREHKFDVTDYAAYEKAKRDVFSSSIGRVACMRGGIIWRLGQGLVKVKAVTTGPSKTQCIQVGQLQGHYLVDDGLPQADEDIICGVYHIKSRMFSLLISCDNTELTLI